MSDIFQSQIILERCQTIAKQIEQEETPHNSLRLTWRAVHDRVVSDNLTPSGISPSRFAAMIVSAPNFVGTWANIPADEFLENFYRRR